MMKKLLCMLFTIWFMLCVLSSCGCEHDWKDADCVTPKTCTLCSETEGEARGHSWQDATCTTPKTCKDCKETEGKTVAHNWLKATCSQPMTCKNCTATEGKELGHKWVEATTEAPTTCSRCKLTEGKKIDTDPRFTTKSTKEFYGKWECEVSLSGAYVGLDGYIDEIPCTLMYDFKNDGNVTSNVELHDYFAFMDAMKKYTKDTLVLSSGMSESDANDWMVANYGMTIDEYVDSYLEAVDMDTLLQTFKAEKVYYVGQNGIYMADSWHEEFEFSEYTINDDTLIIKEDTLEEGGTPLVWKKCKSD